MVDDVNAALRGLNWLNGGELGSEETAGGAAPSTWRSVSGSKATCGIGTVSGPRHLRPEKSFKRLLLDRSGYDLDSAGVAPTPFDLERLSMPEDDVSSSPFFTALLGHADRTMVEEEA